MTRGCAGSIAVRKAQLRTEMRGRLRGLCPAEQREGSIRAGMRLQRDEMWCSARVVGFFVPLPGEVDVRPWLVSALESGKVVCVPGFDFLREVYGMRQLVDPSADLRAGRHGVMEPGDHCARVELNRLDLILVPGLAFDVRGFRLGRGKGHYDRLLRGAAAVRCGVAFDQQIVDHVPIEPHDEKMTRVLTPARWIQTGESGGNVA